MVAWIWDFCKEFSTLQWRHNERHGVSNHQRLESLLNRLFRRRSKKIPKLRVTVLCEGNSPVIMKMKYALERCSINALWMSQLSKISDTAVRVIRVILKKMCTILHSVGFCCGCLSEVFTHILQIYFTSTSAIKRLPLHQWSNLGLYSLKKTPSYMYGIPIQTHRQIVLGLSWGSLYP